MYSRELKPKAARAVTQGICNFGSFSEQFDAVNLVDARKPLLFPFPRFVKQWRLKEWESFHVLGPTHYVAAALYDAKSFSLVQVLVHELGSKRPLIYRRILPFSRCRMPRSLKDSWAVYKTKRLKIGIHNHFNSDAVTIDAAAAGFDGLPDFKARFDCDHSAKKAPPLVSCLPLGPNRGVYSHRALMPASGVLELEGTRIEFPKGKSLAMMCDQKGLYPYRMRLDWVGGMGFDDRGRSFGFSLSEVPAKNPDKFNECALWLDSRLHPLPPVRITRPGGPDKAWIIQDTEGMVDLSFKPAAFNPVDLNFLAVKIEHRGPLGALEGFIATGEGEKLQFQGLFGMGESCSIAL